jgi:DNA-binding winged helix-turn-helix (wHTH) protein/tetratricopeptide (TPR) repeat protein
MGSDSRAHFGPFEADLATGELFTRGVRIRLQDKPFQILALLINRPGELVTRQELCSRLWPDVFVQRSLCLNTAIRRLRKVLAEAAPSQNIVETVGRRGYRLCTSVAMPAALPTKTTRPYVGRPRLVALPFVNLDSTVGDRLGDALTEKMIVRLERGCADGIVVSPSTALDCGRTASSFLEVGSELQADYVLMGTFSHCRSRLRVAARLVRTADRSCLWNDTYICQEREISRVQDAIRSAVSRRLLQPLAESGAASMRWAVAPATHETYLSARYSFASQFVQSAFATSEKLFLQVINEDPRFAPAHAGLALMLMAAALYGGRPPREVYESAERHATAALALSDDMAEAHLALAWRWIWAADWPAAENSILRALEVDPGLALAHAANAYLLFALGSRKRAIAAAKRALALSPASPIVATLVATLHCWAGRLEEARRNLQDCLAVDPRFCPAHMTMSVVLEADSRLNEAADAARTAAQYGSETPLTLLLLARSQALVRDLQEAEVLLHRLSQLRANSYLSPTLMGLTHAALGDYGQAWSCLESAVRDLDPWRIFLAVDPRFKIFQRDARFRRVLHEIGLPSPRQRHLASDPPVVASMRSL